MQKIPRVDMGESLPLRRSVRPMLSALPYFALGATLLGFLPLALTLTTPSKLGWPLVLVAAVGAACALGCVWSVCFRVTYEVTASHAQVRLRRFWSTRTSQVPLSEYVALLTLTSAEPALIGTRGVRQILLWHRSESVKQVMLFAGRNEKKFAQRLEAYRRLFGLPVNPPGLDVVELPAGMPIPDTR
jgi:hypothetical protein